MPFPQAVSLCTHSRFVAWLAGPTDSHVSSPQRLKTAICCRIPGNLIQLSRSMSGVLPSFCFPHRDCILCIYYPLLTPATHCFDRITSGYKIQGSAMKWCPSARTSQAQAQPIWARSSRKRLYFEAETPNLSLCFPCFKSSFFLLSLLLFSSPPSDFILFPI